jgi:hypothetical protein
VGQFVELLPHTLRRAATGAYEIRQTMPVPDISTHSPRYRIKNAAESYERIVAESELAPFGSVARQVDSARQPLNLPDVDN